MVWEGRSREAPPYPDQSRKDSYLPSLSHQLRYGYRKVAKLLRIEGWHVNHKKVERLWKEEGLQLPHRHRKRKRLYHKDSSIIRLRPTHPNPVWSIDFVHDKLSNGRPYKMLTVLDEYTRQALAVTVRPRMTAEDVLEVLYPLLLRHSSPEYMRSDNGPEFVAAAMQDYGRGLIVGEPTIGKGTVQQYRSLNRIYDQMLRLDWPALGSVQYTIQKFYRINGGSTQRKGVTPDIMMPTGTEDRETGEQYEDNALPWDSSSVSSHRASLDHSDRAT